MKASMTRRRFIRGALLGLAGLALHHALGPAGARTVRAEEEKAQAGTESVFDLQGRVCRLSNGMSMPILGLGTYTLMNRVAESSVYEALTAGCRLIDTAAEYGNERGVGQGVKRSGVPREEIFLTTKLWPTNVAMKDIDRRLELLEMDYIDLLLLHQPDGDYTAAYRNMEQAVRQGKARALGLSNFTTSQTEEILSIAEIPPVLMQLETHLHHQQKLTAQYLAYRRIAYEAYCDTEGHYYRSGFRLAYGAGD